MRNFLSGASKSGGVTEGCQGVTQPFLELQTPDFAWEFVWTVQTNDRKIFVTFFAFLTSFAIFTFLNLNFEHWKSLLYYTVQTHKDISTDVGH